MESMRVKEVVFGFLGVRCVWWTEVQKWLEVGARGIDVSGGKYFFEMDRSGPVGDGCETTKYTNDTKKEGQNRESPKGRKRNEKGERHAEREPRRSKEHEGKGRAWAADARESG